MTPTPSAENPSQAARAPDPGQDPQPHDDRVGGASLPLRLYASPLTHRLLPARIALALASTIGPAVRRRHNPGDRDAGERMLNDLLLHTPRAAETEALTREWHRERAQVRELYWRPWLLRRSRIHGREHWAAAHAGGKGCVVVFAHLVAAWAIPAIFVLRGFDVHVIVGPHYWDPTPPGYEGLSLLYRRRQYGEKLFDRAHLIRADDRPSRLLELVDAGASIVTAFDTPGWAATPFLGRNVALGGGPATVAFKAKGKAKVLPVVLERHGTRLDLRMLPPLDPSEHDDLRSLRVAIAETFERVVLERPETVELAWDPSPLVTETPPPRFVRTDRDAAAGQG